MFGLSTFYCILLLLFHWLAIISVLLPAVESDYSVLGPEDNDTGPAATMMTPPQLPVKGSSNNVSHVIQ